MEAECRDRMEGLDREHSAPMGQPYKVTAPALLGSYEAVDWVLTNYGDQSHSIECLGLSYPGTYGQYEFMVTPKL